MKVIIVRYNLWCFSFTIKGGWPQFESNLLPSALVNNTVHPLKEISNSNDFGVIFACRFKNFNIFLWYY